MAYILKLIFSIFFKKVKERSSNHIQSESDENICFDGIIFNLRTRMYQNICFSADLVRGHSAMERDFERTI